MKTGLRIDVDTWRGTREGIPYLLNILQAHGIKASFFMSVGPDNMGRHLWRLLRPAFLKKMIRSRAPGLYGWGIIFQGTCWPGRLIGRHNGEIIKRVADRGHEVGLHAWDHYTWQQHIDRMSVNAIHRDLVHAYEQLTSVLGRPPVSSAVPAWRCREEVLVEKYRFPFNYNSDCRGEHIFYPCIDGQVLKQPQIPVTLPTYDELVGRKGITDENYNEAILDRIKPGRLNVYTIHAEVEGITRMPLFDRLLHAATERGIEFVPLGSLLDGLTDIPSSTVIKGSIPGREGWGSVQTVNTIHD